MSFHSQKRWIFIVLIVLAAGACAVFLSTSLFKSDKISKSTTSEKENFSKAKKPESKGMEAAIRAARKDIDTKINRKVDKKQMMIKMLAAYEGIEKENPTLEDLPPVLREIVNDPNPDSEKYQQFLDRMAEENEKRLEAYRKAGMLEEDPDEELEDYYPPYEPTKRLDGGIDDTNIRSAP